MRKFKIPQMPQTTTKLVGTDCTFSAFVVEAVKVALENLKEDDEENNQA